jgi:hypothetical protein
MKINEILVEYSDDPLVGKLGDITGWNKYQKTDRPTADDDWNPDGEISKSTKAQPQSRQKKSKPVVPETEVPSKSLQRVVMNKIINDQLLMSDDKKFIQSVINSIQSGTIKPNVGANALVEILKLKNAGYTLDKKQIEIVNKYNSSL